MIARHILVVVGVFVAFALRYPFILSIESYDYSHIVSGWYAFIVKYGYFAALQSDFGTYNMPYLYLLTVIAALLPGLHQLFAIKGLSMLFDLALAYFVFKCVEHKHRDSKESAVPILAGLATLFAPTVVLNSSAWGQADAIYTTFLVACLYFLLAGRQAMALIAFGLAFSFKLQAVFLAPLFLFLIARGSLRWRHLVLVPLVYLAMLVPAALAGRPWSNMLSIYLRQADVHPLLSMNFSNLYVWIPNTYYDLWPLGLGLAACVVMLLVAIVYKSSVKITAELTILLATYSVIVVPYILPKMHDRFYFPADVIAIILAFYLPRYWYVPVVVGTVSSFLYLRHLNPKLEVLIGYDIPNVPLELLAFVPAVLIAVLSWQLYKTLYPKIAGPCPFPTHTTETEQ